MPYYYNKYQSPRERRSTRVVFALMSFGAGVAVCTLIQYYFGV